MGRPQLATRREGAEEAASERQQAGRLESDEVTLRERSLVTLSILRTETTTKIQKVKDTAGGGEECRDFEGAPAASPEEASCESSELSSGIEEEIEEEYLERRLEPPVRDPLEMAAPGCLPEVITRTKQDLINSGDYFRVAEKSAPDAAYDHARDHADNPARWPPATRKQSNKMHCERREDSPAPIASHNNYKNSQANYAKTSRTAQRTAAECCYSLANLCVIFASVVALIVLVRFLQDDPLYAYGEYLLTLRFYRQLVFVVIILPLVLLVPIFNALSAIVGLSRGRSNRPAPPSFSVANKKPTTRQALLKVKLFYQLLMFLALLLGLIFLVPYVRSSTLESQLKLELTRFMKTRYDSEFSYRLLDSIQEEYQCCDELWYRANLHDQLPFSCFVPNTNLGVVFGQTCSEALGALVGTRCGVVAICLLVLLFSLAALLTGDLSESMRLAQGRTYNVSSSAPAGYSTSPKSAPPPSVVANQSGGRIDDELLRPYQRQADAKTLDNSLGASFDHEERERQFPLLMGSQNDGDKQEQGEEEEALDDLLNRTANNSRGYPANTSGPSPASKHKQSYQTHSGLNGDALESDSPTRQHKQPPKLPDAPPVLLARANYQMVRRERSQSPVFVTPDSKPQVEREDPANQSIRRPIKSALKKTASSHNVMLEQGPAGGQDSLARYYLEDSDSLDNEDEYAERLRQSDSLLRQKQLQREQQLRRSLLSVRFADDQSN